MKLYITWQKDKHTKTNRRLERLLQKGALKAQYTQATSVLYDSTEHQLKQGQIARLQDN